MKLPEGRSESRRTCFFQNKFASFGKPPEVKLPEGRSESPSFGRTHVLRLPSLPSESARGEAFRRKRRKPPEVKLPEGRTESPSFGRTHVLRLPSLPSESATPTEVKLSEGSRASFRKPKEAKQVQKANEATEASFFPSFRRTHVLRLPSLPSESARGEAFRRKPPEVKLPEGRSESPCFGRTHVLRLPPEGRASSLASFRKGVLLSFFQKGRPPELLSERAFSRQR